MTKQDAGSIAGQRLSRRRVVQLGYGGAVALVAGAVGVRELAADDRVSPTSSVVARAERSRRSNGRSVQRTISARVSTVDLGGRTVETWAYDGLSPTNPIRVTAGDTLNVSLRNQLPESTTIHWHGLALRNDMDGVPGVTMRAVRPGDRFDYSFIVPDPGTYWFHPHVGVQLDTGLQGPLIVEDPREPGRYDSEAVLVLDDWTDGWAESPGDILQRFKKDGMGGMKGMGGMSMGDASEVDPREPLGKDAGDVVYPAHLINGRVAEDPSVIEAKRGDRIRLRLINAASDTAYRFSIGDHRMTVTHTDGYPVKSVEVDSLVIGMGERFDVLITAGDGDFPIFAVPVGKVGSPARSLLRTARRSRADDVRTARPPSPGTGRLLAYDDLKATGDVRLVRREPDRLLDVELAMGKGGREWLINGVTFEDFEALEVKADERVRLNFVNRSMMFHPMHLHGHTFQMTRRSADGPRKDTVNVRPMTTLSVDVQADNPGQWLLHCHNAYHGELGMMTVLSYVR